MPNDSMTRKGLDLASVLALACLDGARVVAGAEGLHRRVSRLNVMEVPDIAAWVKPDELLLTTGYPLRQEPERWIELVSDLADAGLAGVAVKLGRYVEDLPPEMLDEADRRSFPVIELPAETAFDEVIGQVLEAVLDNQASLLSRGDDANRALVEIVLAGGDLTLLCEGLVRLLGGAVLVTASAGDLVAQAGDTELIDQSRELPCFDDAGRFQAASAGSYPTEGATIGIANERIAAGGVGLGHLVLLNRERDLVEEDLHVLERAATVAALAITKSEAVTAVDAKYRSDFLRDVLTGRAGSAQRMTAHAHSLGWDLTPVVVVVAALDDADEESLSAADLRDLDARLTRAWTRAVSAAHKSAPVAGFRDEVVALIPVAVSWDHRRTTEQVTAIATAAQNDRTASLPTTFSAGISRVVTHLDELPRAYDHARRALAVGRKVHGQGALMAFDALGVFRLLALVDDTAELTSFAEDALGRLVIEPSRDSQDLLHTLSVLLDTGMNVAETARLLHFHYNTLRYRITKLEEILGPFTTDSQLRLRISLALQVLEMRGA